MCGNVPDLVITGETVNTQVNVPKTELLTMVDFYGSDPSERKRRTTRDTEVVGLIDRLRTRSTEGEEKESPEFYESS